MGLCVQCHHCVRDLLCQFWLNSFAYFLYSIYFYQNIEITELFSSPSHPIKYSQPLGPSVRSAVWSRIARSLGHNLFIHMWIKYNYSSFFSCSFNFLLITKKDRLTMEICTSLSSLFTVWKRSPVIMIMLLNSFSQNTICTLNDVIYQSLFCFFSRQIFQGFGHKCIFQHVHHL